MGRVSHPLNNIYTDHTFLLFCLPRAIKTVRPHCQPGQQTAYGASRNEVVTVRCAVDAHPASDLTFRWMFNSTLAVTEVANNTISSSGWQSNVTHRIYQNEQQDYGTLLCWARNAVGEQREPCVFSIQPAGLFLLLVYVYFRCLSIYAPLHSSPLGCRHLY